jgi:SnoaL-like polyketide cyclase
MIGPWQGLDGTVHQATGKTFELEFCTVARWKDGEIVEENLFYDQVGFLRQNRRTLTRLTPATRFSRRFVQNGARASQSAVQQGTTMPDILPAIFFGHGDPMKA